MSEERVSLTVCVRSGDIAHLWLRFLVFSSPVLRHWRPHHTLPCLELLATVSFNCDIAVGMRAGYRTPRIQMKLNKMIMKPATESNTQSCLMEDEPGAKACFSYKMSLEGAEIRHAGR